MQDLCCDKEKLCTLHKTIELSVSEQTMRETLPGTTAMCLQTWKLEMKVLDIKEIKPPTALDGPAFTNDQ